MTLEYVSAAANSCQNCLDLSTDGNFVYYASSNGVVVADLKDKRVCGISDSIHSGAVTCVRVIKSLWKDMNTAYILSCSSDCTSKLYEVTSPSDGVTHTLKTVAVLAGHTSAVRAGDGLLTIDNKILIVTVADDFSLRGFRIDGATGTVCDHWMYRLPGRALALDVCILYSLQGDQPVLAYGGDDGHIHILVSDDWSAGYRCDVNLSGHGDWVMTLAHMQEDGGDTLLASGSKDGTIRMWRFKAKSCISDDSADELKTRTIELEVPSVGEAKTYLCLLEAALLGHDGVITHVHWAPLVQNVNERHQPLQLLSCAKTEDRSVILWQPEGGHADEEGLWVETVRLGEVGGNREGFFVAKLAASADSIIATSYQGGIHIWKYEEHAWKPQVAFGGHFNEVVDLDWMLHGKCLISTSIDQTTRIHAPCSVEGKVIWHEIARPQIHGYDMSCVVSIGGLRVVSGAEEKVIRGFAMTSGFMKNLKASCNVNMDGMDNLEVAEQASVPCLGLSNKVILSEDNSVKAATITSEGALPNEVQLMQSTLWPEICKLYGHGNEILCMAATSDGKFLASACKATTEIDASVIIWSTEDWKQVCSLQAHRLSVCQMSFSCCDNYLLSVSRDRTWTVFRTDGCGFSYLFSSNSVDKVVQHSRIIWSCDWLHGTLSFVTGSRDKMVAVWSPTEATATPSSWRHVAVSREKNEVTAVAACRVPGSSTKFVIARGLVDGMIRIHTYDTETNAFLSCTQVTPSHRKTVRRLRFRSKEPLDMPLVLASCGNDYAVHVYYIHNV